MKILSDAVMSPMRFTRPAWSARRTLRHACLLVFAVLLSAGGLPVFGQDAAEAGLPEAGLPEAGLPEAGLPGAGLPGAGLPGAGLPGAGAEAMPAGWRELNSSALLAELRLREPQAMTDSQRHAVVEHLWTSVLGAAQDAETFEARRYLLLAQWSVPVLDGGQKQRAVEVLQERIVASSDIYPNLTAIRMRDLLRLGEALDLDIDRRAAWLGDWLVQSEGWRGQVEGEDGVHQLLYVLRIRPEEVQRLGGERIMPLLQQHVLEEEQVFSKLTFGVMRNLQLVGEALGVEPAQRAAWYAQWVVRSEQWQAGGLDMGLSTLRDLDRQAPTPDADAARQRVFAHLQQHLVALSQQYMQERDAGRLLHALDRLPSEFLLACRAELLPFLEQQIVGDEQVLGGISSVYLPRLLKLGQAMEVPAVTQAQWLSRWVSKRQDWQAEGAAGLRRASIQVERYAEHADMSAAQQTLLQLATQGLLADLPGQAEVLGTAGMLTALVDLPEEHVRPRQDAVRQWLLDHFGSPSRPHLALRGAEIRQLMRLTQRVAVDPALQARWLTEWMSEGEVWGEPDDRAQELAHLVGALQMLPDAVLQDHAPAVRAVLQREVLSQPAVLASLPLKTLPHLEVTAGRVGLGPDQQAAWMLRWIQASDHGREVGLEGSWQLLQMLDRQGEQAAAQEARAIVLTYLQDNVVELSEQYMQERDAGRLLHALDRLPSEILHASRGQLLPWIEQRIVGDADVFLQLPIESVRQMLGVARRLEVPAATRGAWLGHWVTGATSWGERGLATIRQVHATVDAYAMYADMRPVQTFLAERAGEHLVRESQRHIEAHGAEAFLWEVRQLDSATLAAHGTGLARLLREQIVEHDDRFYSLRYHEIRSLRSLARTAGVASEQWAEWNERWMAGSDAWQAEPLKVLATMLRETSENPVMSRHRAGRLRILRHIGERALTDPAWRTEALEEHFAWVVGGLLRPEVQADAQRIEQAAALLNAVDIWHPYGERLLWDAQNPHRYSHAVRQPYRLRLGAMSREIAEPLHAMLINGRLEPRPALLAVLSWHHRTHGGDEAWRAYLDDRIEAHPPGSDQRLQWLLGRGYAAELAGIEVAPLRGRQWLDQAIQEAVDDATRAQLFGLRAAQAVAVGRHDEAASLLAGMGPQFADSDLGVNLKAWRQRLPQMSEADAAGADGTRDRIAEQRLQGQLRSIEAQLAAQEARGADETTLQALRRLLRQTRDHLAALAD